MPRTRARLGIAGIAATAVCVAAALAGWLTCSSSGDNDDRRAQADQPIERQAPADGWDAIDVPPLDDTYRLTATRDTADGIERDTAFILESSVGGLDAGALRTTLSIDPPADVEFDGGGDRVEIRPKAPLREGTRYRFALRDATDGRQLRSWAFQTVAPLRIIQTLPAHRATMVPRATGIEMTFSHDGVTGVEDRFSIDPAVDGRFEVHKRVVVFVPEALEPETLYTVTIAAGVRVGDDLETAEPHVFSFETGALVEREAQFNAEGPFFSRLVFESSTLEPPSLEMLAYDAAEIDLPVELYRLDDEDAFVEAIESANAVPYWSLYARRDFRIDTNGLSKTMSFTANVTAVGVNNTYNRLVAFPEPLEPGYYVVQGEHEGNEIQALLQVTDLASYASVSTTKTLVWVNDLATGAPLDGASVIDDEDDRHSTGTDGVALFDTPDGFSEFTGDEDPRVRFFRVEHDGRSAVLTLNAYAPIGYYGYGLFDPRGGSYSGFSGRYYGGPSTSPDYWSYIYPDRQLYHPSDEVRFWGIAKHREDFEPGIALTARLDGGGYFDSYYRSSVLAEATVTISDLGTFEGALSFEGVSPGSYQLSVLQGQETIAATYVQIQDFVKPSWRIDITPSRRAAIAGDLITFDITTAFFDGSPVPFAELEYLGDAGSQRIRTDADGRASVQYVAQDYGAFSGPAYRGVNAYAVGPEQGEIQAQTQVYVLPSALAVRGEGDVDGGTATVTGTVHIADLSAFEDDERWYDAYAGAPSVGRPVVANVTEFSYNKIEDGEEYDFIAKLVRKRYRYELVERSVGSFSAVTGSEGQFVFTFPVRSEHSYVAHVSAIDDAGRTGGTDVYVSGDEFVYVPYADTRLSLQETTSEQTAQYSYGDNAFELGENVDLTVRRSGDAAEAGGAFRYLFLRSRNGLREYEATADPRLQWAFGDDDVPNVNVSAIQFNGRGYEAACCDFSARLDHETREITLDIETDAERYEPGGDVTLSVLASDAEGNPIASEVLLSLVDEAIFQLQGDYEADFLQQLYRDLPSGVITTYLPSYTAVSELQRQYGGPNTGGNFAGQGAAVAAPDTGPGIREDFRDLALFRTVRTDASGAGTVTFTLPDNITSWRVTARAITGDLRGGAGIAAVPVGLPFFVEVTVADEYLTADRPVIAMRAFGTALSSGDAIEYRIDAPTIGVVEATVAGEAFRGASFELPPLTEGEHEVTVRATSGDLGDGIERKLRIVPSRLRRGEARYAELTSGVALEGAASGMTRVVFTDHNRGRYFDDLRRLSWGWGDRVDQQLARVLAQRMLADYFEEEPQAEDFDAALYQTDLGGVALFPYAQEELLLSARIVSVAPAEFGLNELAQYFRAVFDDPDETRERASIALFGLGAAGEPVLPSIDAMAAADDLTPRERLYLGLAALAAGDDAAAREQYRQVVARYGERQEPFARVRFGTDQDDILELTALAADLGAGIGDPSAAALFEYTQANATTDLLIELDQISYLSRALPVLPSEESRFAYTLRGERIEQTLEKGRSLYLTLTPGDLAALEPQTIEGRVGVATHFEAPFDPASVARDADIGVTRIVDVDGGGIAEGDIVQVRLDWTLSPQSLDGCYQVVDIAPSGLRPLTRGRYGSYPFIENTISPYRVEGQRVSFCVSLDHDRFPAAYFARVVTKGEYAVEPATIQSMQSADSFNFSATDTITIQ